MFDTILSYIKRLSGKISRSELALRMMGRLDAKESESTPGVIMIQVDGLSYSQLQNALSRKRLPFIRTLMKAHKFNLKPFYSGMPSTTPAVQGELHFGVKSAVPSFEFIDRTRDKHMVMFYAASAGQVAADLAREGGPPLLENGTSYSNIYAGGAKEARYCAETMNLENLLQALNPLKFLMVALLHVVKVFRVLGVSMVELFVALFDFFKGLKDGKNFFKELKFVPARVFMCIVLRELIRFRVKMDLVRGVPIIHANFAGYDEQAHRRGPGSAFAHWTLKGIDWVIEDIGRSAFRSNSRTYRLIIFSDHGQETVDTWGYKEGLSLDKAVRNAYARAVPDFDRVPEASRHRNGMEYLFDRAENLREYFFFGNRRKINGPASFSFDDISITDMGPLCQVYLPRTIDSAQREKLARHLVEVSGIPLVLLKNENMGTVTAVNKKGVFDLIGDKASVLGADHYFLTETAEDLKQVCFHPKAGDLILSGWSPHEMPQTFAVENGAHGGPGKEESRGFVLLPPEMGNDQKSFLRPLDLRALVLSQIGDRQNNLT